MVTKTSNFKFNLITLDDTPWHEFDHDNWRIIDTVLAKFVAIVNLVGVWDNSLAIAVGERHIDREAGTIWTALVAHTSPSTGTFAESREAIPSNWELFSSIDATFAGNWVTNTSYAQNSFLVDANRYGVTVATYTSSDSYDTDVVNGNIITLIDVAQAVIDAEAAAVSAAASAATISLPLAVASGGTGGTTAALGRAGLEIDGASNKIAYGDLPTGTEGGGLVFNSSGILSEQIQFSTGDVKLTLKTAADTGWVLFDDGNIGNASSSATTRANADTEDLFTLLWTNTIDANCAVSTGRGASAAADYAANKTIDLPKALGRALATYGTGSGLTARALAETLGEEDHVLLEAELASHAHGLPHGSSPGAGPTVQENTTNTTTTPASNSAGSDTAHNVMQPTLFLNTMVKL